MPDSVAGETDSDATANALPSLGLKSVAVWGKDGGFGRPGDGPGEFNAPSGIAISNGGNEVFVFDGGNHRIQVLDRSGVPLREWHHPTESLHSTIAVGPDDTIYIVDDTVHGIVGYSPLGEIRKSWPIAYHEVCHIPNSESGHGLALTPNGDIAVTDSEFGEVQIFSRDGVLQKRFGTCGTDKGEFAWGPMGITVYHNQYVVSDRQNVLRFELDGTFAGNIAAPPGMPYESVGGWALTSANGWLLMAEDTSPPWYGIAPGFERITHVWPGVKGNDRGQVLWNTQIAVGDDNLLYVTDANGNRVQVFSLEPE